jgi:hypothetical protein
MKLLLDLITKIISPSGMARVLLLDVITKIISPSGMARVLKKTADSVFESLPLSGDSMHVIHNFLRSKGQLTRSLSTRRAAFSSTYCKIRQSKCHIRRLSIIKHFH